MLSASFGCILIVTFLLFSPCMSDDLPTCQPSDFHYEYTECDSDGGRWRVSVPKPNVCVGGAPNPPVRGKGCEFTCEAGQYLDLQGDQVCHPCAPGTYSLGGGVRYEDWETIPSDFSMSTEEFSYHGFESVAESEESQTPNCSSSVWQARGNVIQAMPGNCSALLVYTANLVKPGYVKFAYQYASSGVMFHFKVQNSQCQTVRDKESNKYLEPTDEDEWKTFSTPLPSGINVIYWRAMAIHSSRKARINKPIQIKFIEVHGVAYTSECSKCPAGTTSVEGASSCDECAANTFAEKGAPQCTGCDPITEYSEPRSSSCTKKLPCTADDYFGYNSPCDRENNTTQLLYKWVEPKLCRDDLPESVKLPPAGDLEDCPPCNPGMGVENGTCAFCPENYYGDGKTPCEPCPVSTAPEVKQVYKWWTTLPEISNITAACISLNERGCATRTGWLSTPDFIHTGKGHADDAYLVISLDVGGFRGREQTIAGKPVLVAEVTFTFELNCHKDCIFAFMQVGAGSESTVVEQWVGETKLTKYTHKVYKTGPVTYSWAFQKVADESSNVLPYHQSHSFLLRDDVAKIYEITVTNPLVGGAATCRTCDKGVDSTGCVSCPPGQYMNGTRCAQCPPGTVIEAGSAGGVEACMPCGEGLVTSDNVRCFSPCKLSTNDGKTYDFTPLASAQIVEGARLFSTYGSQYFQEYHISLCGDGLHLPLAQCSENISLALGKSNVTSPTLDYLRKDEVVQSPVCRITMVPPRPGEGEDGMMTAPISIGDVLVSVTNNKSAVADVRDKMKAEGFPMSDDDMDVYFTYISETTTAVCKDGRSTVVALRCDTRAEGNGTVEMSPKFPMGTSDGCNFHLLWKTAHACALCKDSEFIVVKGECVGGQQEVHYIPPEYCVLLSDSKGYVQKQACSVLPFWAMIAIAVTMGCGLIMCCLLVYCWKRNKKLEYKYMKLIQNSTAKDGELPAVESCGLDDDDDEEPCDAHHNMIEVRDEASRTKFFNKIRVSSKKDGAFEDIHLSEKVPLT